MTDNASRPLTVLISALGGQGGGVLANWLVVAARRADLPVQSTSIPGVAQRTGATTYYLEIWPRTWAELDGRRPVLGLTATLGEVDLMVVSELLEAGRAIDNGFITPDRTSVIASTHRVLTTVEKMAMGDGRYDRDALIEAVEARSKTRLLLDMEDIARTAKSAISAVLLGVIAGLGRLPIAAATLRESITAQGLAVESNLRGFDAGLAAAGGQAEVDTLTDHKRAFPAAVQDLLDHAADRLTDYQDAAYATHYLDRLKPFRDAAPAVLSAVVRHLAVRMSFEDIIRVAQAKTRPGRTARIRDETGAGPGDPVRVIDFFKPGLAEICDVLPEKAALRLLALAARWPWLARRHWSLEVKTTTVSGFARVWLLARMRPMRRRTYRYRREQRAIDGWLALILRAAAVDADLAVEFADCARLIKGYGDTHRRGSENFSRIRDALLMPALAGDAAPSHAAAAIAEARTAALADPEGAALTEMLADHASRDSTPEPLAASAE